MNEALTVLANQWARLGAELDEVLATGSAADQALRLATLLQPLAPAGFAACLLNGGEAPASLAWRAGAWQPPAELDGWLSEGLAHPALDRSGALRLPDLEKKAKVRTQATALVHAEERRGVIVLAQPEDTAADWLVLTDSLLRFFAHSVGLHFHLQTAAAQRSGLRQQQEETESAVLRGDSVLALTHDLNNHLNRIMLQMAVVQTKLDAPLREDLTPVRQEVRLAATLLRPLQQSWHEQRSQAGTVDLNGLLVAVRDSEVAEAARAHLDLAADLPALRATRGSLRRLLRLLLLASLSRQPAPGPIHVRTWTDKGLIRLSVADGGPSLSERGLADPLDAEEGAFAQRPMLERLAIQSLLRAVEASLQVAARPEGGAVLTIAWK